MEEEDEKYDPKLQLVFQECGGLYNYIFRIMSGKILIYLFSKK